MNCQKYRYKAERQIWVKKAGIPYLYVVGNPELNKEYLIIGDVLYLKCPDDYNSLPRKVIMAYDIIIKINPKIDYILKTDDDQDLINPNFFRVVLPLIETNKYDYGGHMINIGQPQLSRYYLIHESLPKDMILQKTKYCSGRFYFLSRVAVLCLLKNKENIQREYLEDYAIGYYLNKDGEKNILNIKTDKYFIDYQEFG